MYDNFLQEYEEERDVLGITDLVTDMSATPKIFEFRGFPEDYFRIEEESDPHFVAIPGWNSGPPRRKVDNDFRVYCSQWDYSTVVLYGGVPKLNWTGLWQQGPRRMAIGRFLDLHKAIAKAIKEEQLFVNPVRRGQQRNGLYLPHTDTICNEFDLTNFLS